MLAQKIKIVLKILGMKASCINSSHFSLSCHAGQPRKCVVTSIALLALGAVVVGILSHSVDIAGLNQMPLWSSITLASVGGLTFLAIAIKNCRERRLSNQQWNDKIVGQLERLRDAYRENKSFPSLRAHQRKSIPEGMDPNEFRVEQTGYGATINGAIDKLRRMQGDAIVHFAVSGRSVTIKIY